jgi:hypothetical protein
MLPHLVRCLVRMTRSVELISYTGPSADRILGEQYTLGPDGLHRMVGHSTRISLILSLL